MRSAPAKLAAVQFDAGRALWLPGQGLLVIADLHLGYAWAHRHSGQMLPIGTRESTADRLAALIAKHRPAEIALLGDIVHRAAPVAAIERELSEMCQAIQLLLDARSRSGGSAAGLERMLYLIAGNHDRGLEQMLGRCGLKHELIDSLHAGPHLLMHGDGRDHARARDQLELARSRGGQVIMGHEHPAIRLGDGVTSVKCPCFLEASDLLILPAFSDWAAGSNVRNGQFLSALAQQAHFTSAHAILAGKLVRVPLGSPDKAA